MVGIRDELICPRGRFREPGVRAVRETGRRC